MSYEAKIVLLGTTLVGKTTIVTRSTTGDFDQSIKPTVGACYASQTFTFPEGTVRLQIWDTAGQERFKTLVPMYYRGARVVVIVFSVTDQLSFEEVEFWARGPASVCSPPPTFVLVANKIDLAEERCISCEQGQELAARLKAQYFEVSARDGTGISEMLDFVAKVALRSVIENQPTESVTVHRVRRTPRYPCCRR